MTDTIFEIVDKAPSSSLSNIVIIKSAYNQLLRNYVSQVYGTTTEAFIKKITFKIQNENQNLLKFDFRKEMRDLCKKFFLTDLELIFLTYFSNLNKWNFNHQVIIQNKRLMKCFSQDIEPYSVQFKFYLYLMAYFVKNYVGDKQQLSVLAEYHQNQIPYFNQIYQQWLDKSQKAHFIISPRQLNFIYTQFSKNPDKKASKKDYNCMVDRILELSTTYSIMPSREEKKIKSKKQIQEASKYSSSPKKRHKRSFQSGIFEFSPKYQLNEIKLRNKSIIISGSSQYIQKKSNAPSSSLIQSSNKGSDIPKRTVTLKRKKNEDNQNQVNNTVKNYFQSKNSSQVVEQQKKNQSNLKQLNPVPFFDLNIRSSGIQSLPFQLRSNSNIFGPSKLF